MSEQTVLIDEDASAHAIRTTRKLRQVKVEPPAHPQTLEWVAAERRRRNLELDVQALVTKQERLRLAILERWSMDGTQRESVAGQAVYLQRKLYPKVADKAALATALREEGLLELLTVDEKAFAAYVTQMDEEGRPLPDSIQALAPQSFERFALVVKLT